jgi:large subunit ribosomal protein L3
MSEQQTAGSNQPQDPQVEAAEKVSKEAPRDKKNLGGFKNILGTKLGMTQIFGKDGEIIPVTLIQAGPCPVVQVKDTAKDGYNALQLAWGADDKEKNYSKAIIAHFKKANLKPHSYLREFRIKEKIDGIQPGDEIKVDDVFSIGDYVDISGFTKGKGYQGVMKRWNFGGGPRTHGQSDRQRAPGASGSQRPQRVIKGMRGAGHMGDVWRTIQRIKVIDIVPEKNLIAIRGSAPGPNKCLLVIKKTVKKVIEKKVSLIPEKAKGKGKAPTREPGKTAAKAPAEAGKKKK